MWSVSAWVAVPPSFGTLHAGLNRLREPSSEAISRTRPERSKSERSLEHFGVHFAEAEDAAAFDVVEHDLGRAEEHWVDLVEVVAGFFEDVEERFAVGR